jgi:hypothetical protein
MSDILDSSGEMYRFLETHRSGYADEVVDRLLSGRLDPDDAPAELRAVAALFATATAAGSAVGIERRAEVVSTAALAVRSSLEAAPVLAQRRHSMLSKLFTAKAALGATAAVLGIGTAAAAATGSLPGQTSHASAHATAGLDTAAAHVGQHRSSSSPGSEAGSQSNQGASTGSIPATGPANTNAQFGLCTAFLAANTDSSVSSTSPPQDGSTAFKALIAENGGSIAATITYCQGVVTAPPSHSGASNGSGKSHRPSDAGKPSSAGRSSSHAKVTTPNSGGTSTANQASDGHSSKGTSQADSKSGGRSSAGSGNSSGHGHS